MIVEGCTCTIFDLFYLSIYHNAIKIDSKNNRDIKCWQNMADHKSLCIIKFEEIINHINIRTFRYFGPSMS